MKRSFKILICILVLLLSTVLMASCGDRLPTPTGLKDNQDTQSVSWKKVTGASTYTVSLGEDLKEITTRSTSIALDHLEPGSYEVKVRANSADEDVASSDWASFTFVRAQENGLRYKLINNKTEYEVVGGGIAEGEVIIPSEYRGKPVTSIGDKAFINNKRITKITVGENVKSIGKNAFARAAELTTVVITDNVRSIGEYAFQSCKKLKSVALPESITSISPYMFSWCSSLESVTMGDKVTEIGIYAFSNCESLLKIELPDTVTRIGEYAFSDCEAMSSVIARGVVFIEKFAFYNCYAISTLDLGESIVTVADEAFGNCKALTQISIPDTTVSIGDKAFMGCTALEEVTLGESLKQIGTLAFMDTKLYESTEDLLYIGNWLVFQKNEESGRFDIKEGTVGIADGALAGCSKIDSMTLTGIKYIGAGAFYGCTELFEVITDESLLGIGDYAFLGCSVLKKVELGPSLTTLGDGVFMDCVQLSAVKLPDSLTSVGTYCFDNTNIYKMAKDVVYVDDKWVVGVKGDYHTDIVIKEGVVGIANHSFYNRIIFYSVQMPESLRYIGRSAFYGCAYTMAIVIPDGVKSIGDYAFFGCQSALFGDNGLFNLPSELQYLGRSAFYNCKYLIGVTVPGSLKQIGAYAFYGCENMGVLTGTDENGDAVVINGGIVIADGVERIGERAFQNCTSLDKIIIPDSVTEIGYRAFYKCENLKSVKLGSGIDTIGDYMFYNCSALESVEMQDSIKSIGTYAFRGCTALTEINIGRGVESIGNFAFYACTSVTELVIPTNVKSVGNYAFRGCTALTSVIIPETLESIGKHAFYGIGAATVYCECDTIAPYWNSRWNSSYRPVFWGCELSEDKTYVVSFTKTSEDNPENRDVQGGISAPVREGYVFDGWALEPDGTVVYGCDNVAYSVVNTTLYAKWSEYEELPENGTELPNDPAQGEEN